MQDVADAAGVSQATVSLVLNDVVGSGIAEATMIRVRAEADRLGYRHNRMARNLKLQRSDSIGFVSEHIMTSPLAVGMVQGAQDAARAAGKHLLIENVDFDPDEPHIVSEQRAIGDLLERQVDGIVLASMFHRVVEVPAILHETNAVLLDARSLDGSVSSVVPDEYAGAAAATSHLLDAGHRHIIHLTGPLGPPASNLRQSGFMDAFMQLDLEADPEWIVESEVNTPCAYEAMRDLLASREKPTAVFCFNDEMAWGVYQAASEIGLSIPVDLSVVGFDDIRLIAPVLRPALTTMRLPHYEMGRWAVERLLSDSEGIEELAMECPVVERDSVARARH